MNTRYGEIPLISVWDGDVRLDGEYIHIDSDPQITIQPEITRKIRQAIIEQAIKAVELARIGGQYEIQD